MSRLNRPHWKRQRGLYEVWYLTLHDKASGWAFWFRYTLNAPPRGRGAPEAHLWAFSFPPEGSGPALELIDRYPAQALRFDPKGDVFGLTLGPGRFEFGPRGAQAQGDVGAGERRIRWRLDMSPPETPPFRHVAPALYRLKVASSSVSTPGMRMRVSGTVELGGRTIRLDGALAEQGHVYGRRHAHRWVWAHCHDFDDHPGAVFEGVSAEVLKAGVVLPAASPMCVALDRETRWTWNTPWTMWGVESSFELGRWTFEARRKDVIVTGLLTAAPESFVSVEYRDPDGKQLYCNHTESADLSLEITRRVDDVWGEPVTYRSEGRTAFEFGAPERDPRAARVLDHSQIRPA